MELKRLLTLSLIKYDKYLVLARPIQSLLSTGETALRRDSSSTERNQLIRESYRHWSKTSWRRPKSSTRCCNLVRQFCEQWLRISSLGGNG